MTNKIKIIFMILILLLLIITTEIIPVKASNLDNIEWIKNNCQVINETNKSKCFELLNTELKVYEMDDRNKTIMYYYMRKLENDK